MGLDVNENGVVVNEEKEKRMPVIKGYPELRWTGKRQFNERI